MKPKLSITQMKAHAPELLDALISLSQAPDLSYADPDDLHPLTIDAIAKANTAIANASEPALDLDECQSPHYTHISNTAKTFS